MALGSGYEGLWLRRLPAHLLAEALGMTTEEFQAARAAGQTGGRRWRLPRVSSCLTWVAAVIAPPPSDWPRPWPTGRLTQEQADTDAATMTEHMTSHFQDRHLWRLAAGCKAVGMVPRWNEGRALVCPQAT